MARLQDFQTVTPTSSDKLLVVQSQGQGLVPYGSKLDSANPTGTGKVSINRLSGSAEGNYSVAIGYKATASGSYSFAEGNECIASGNFGSHVEGLTCIASGDYGAHAENSGTIASGRASHSSGTGTKANRKSQFVFGEYNVEETGTTTNRGTYIELVGNGTADNARSNARTLDWSGNEVLAGGLKINGTEDVKAIKTTTVSGTTDNTGNIVASDLTPSNKMVLSAVKRRKNTESSNLDLAIVSFMPNSGETAYIFHLVNNDGTVYANKSDVKILVAYIDI